MSDNEIDQLRDLYLTALQYKTEERQNFIEQVGVDDENLKKKLEIILREHENPNVLFDRPAWSIMERLETSRRVKFNEYKTDSDLPFNRLGEYRLIRKIGKGGMGAVYLALQDSTQREVALKIIHHESRGSLAANERFSREINIISNLKHPNIVVVYSSGEQKGIRYLAMELVSGKGLNKIIEKKSLKKEGVPASVVLRWIRDIARALQAAHEKGVIHRDIKPANIMITPEGIPKLMDFGIARHVDLDTLTATGEFRGSPFYASPEQVEARPKGVDARTDVYSLGVALYEAVTGQLPFKGDTTTRLFHEILIGDPISPRRLINRISRDLETIILKAIEKNPDSRYPTMEIFADDLDRVLNGEMIYARPVNLCGRIWKRWKRNRIAGVAVAALAVALMFLFFLIPYSYCRMSMLKEEANKRATDAKAAVEFLCDEVLVAFDPSIVDDGKVVLQMLNKASKNIDVNFKEAPNYEARIRRAFGEAYRKADLFEVQNS